MNHPRTIILLALTALIPTVSYGQEWNETPRVVKPVVVPETPDARPPALTTKGIWGKTNALSDPEIRIHDLIQIVGQVRERLPRAEVHQESTEAKPVVVAVPVTAETESNAAGESPKPDVARSVKVATQSKGLPEGDQTAVVTVARKPEPPETKSPPRGAIQLRLPLTARVIEVLPNGNLLLEATRDIQMGERTKTVRFTAEVARHNVSDLRITNYDHLGHVRIWVQEETRPAPRKGAKINDLSEIDT